MAATPVRVTTKSDERCLGTDAGAFPEQQYLDDCVHCGFCLPACPTYVLWREEMDSPRGRIYMVGKTAHGEAPLDARFRQHMDNCLGCMACMTACPSGVQYNKILEPARARIEYAMPRSVGESLFRKLLFATFPYPQRLRFLAWPLLLYQRTGLQSAVRATGVTKLLPRRLRALESLLPQVPRRTAPSLPMTLRPEGAPRRRVGMLSGCVQRVFFPQVNAATARVLVAEGCAVVIPPEQPCCGALMLHSGMEEEAMASAKKMIAAFEAAEVETIVINSAGCGSAMKEYGHLLRKDPAWAERAAAFSARCKDISEVLCALDTRAARHPLPLRVAWHDACHLRHAQGVFDEPRRLLAAIPGLEVKEIADGSLCCGSAGIYNLLQPEPAAELGRHKVDNLLATGAEAVASANPGCLLQLMQELRQRGTAMPAFHMVELLDASMRGITAEELQRERERH